MGDRPGDRRTDNRMVPALPVLHLWFSRNYSSGDMEKENNLRLAPGGHSELCPCGYRLRSDQSPARFNTSPSMHPDHDLDTPPCMERDDS